MIGWFAKRLAMMAVMLFGVSVITFLVPYLTGRDPASAILRSRIAEAAPSPELIESIRVELGLDRSLPVQYLAWLQNVVRGDLGLSYVSREPVAPLLIDALWVSFTLAIVALAIAVAVSIPLGTVAALRPGKWLDNLITGLTQTGVAVPEYWLGPVLILVFALWLGWLPSAGWRGGAFIVLPALTLALRPISYFTRLTRASMLDVLNAPYITAARARGLRPGQTVLRHGIRNALIPVVTLFSLWLAGLLGGSVVVEVIFAIPGMGRMIYQAVLNADLPIVQAGIMAIVGLAIVLNTLTDLFYGVLNPAIGVTGKAAR